MGFDRATRWHAEHTGHHSDWTPERLAAERRRTISVCLPARDEAETIGAVVDALTPLLDRGVIDELVVVDDSRDGTAEIAAARGAEVHRQDELCPELGPVLGKGDAMWRSLSVLSGEVLCFLDADSSDLGPHYACGLVGPIACSDEIQFVKGFYRRPLQLDGIRLPQGGGRVTELCARPLLNALYPELAGIRQPLAGEIAVRSDLLARLSFATGYAVDIALLIDAWRECGLDAMAQVDLDVRQNRHQPLADLTPMAAAVLQAVLDRAQRDGRFVGEVGRELLLPLDGTTTSAVPTGLIERPALSSLATMGV